MAFVIWEFRTFVLLETFSPVVQRSAVHLYAPPLCTGFIGNSCVFSLIIMLCSNGNLVAGSHLWAPVGKCAPGSLSSVYFGFPAHGVFLCDGRLSSSSHRWKCLSTQPRSYLHINVCQTRSCFPESKCSSVRTERESWSLIKIWSLNIVTALPR